MPHIVAVCPQCHEIRYRSLQPTDDPKPVLKAVDFQPLGEQPDAADGEPPLCYSCGAQLKFGKEPEKAQAGPASREERMAMARERSVIQAKTASSGNLVQTLFQVNPDETLVKMDEISPLKFLVATSKRILIIDAQEMQA